MADPPVTDEGPPAGREDPNADKIMGFPWWVWGLAAVGTFGVVWFLHNQSGSNSTDVTGSASNTPSDLGVTSTDLSSQPTLSAVLSAMQALATREGATSVSPAAPAPQLSVVQSVSRTVQAVAGAISSTHTTGGAALESVTVNRLPSLDLNPGPGKPAVQAVNSGMVTVKKPIGFLDFSRKVQQKVVSFPAFNPIHARTSGNQAIA